MNNTPLHVHPVATIRRVVKDDVAAPRRHVLWMEGGVRARPAVRRYVIVWVREDVQNRTVLGAVGAVFPRLIAFARTVRAAFAVQAAVEGGRALGGHGEERVPPVRLVDRHYRCTGHGEEEEEAEDVHVRVAHRASRGRCSQAVRRRSRLK